MRGRRRRRYRRPHEAKGICRAAPGRRGDAGDRARYPVVREVAYRALQVSPVDRIHVGAAEDRNRQAPTISTAFMRGVLMSPTSDSSLSSLVLATYHQASA